MTVVTPVGPTGDDAVCRGGVLQPPTLTLPETDGITYRADPAGPYAMFQNVTVTATLDDAEAGVAAIVAGGVDGDVGSGDGDVRGGSSVWGVHAGVAGGSGR